MGYFKNSQGYSAYSHGRACVHSYPVGQATFNPKTLSAASALPVVVVWDTPCRVQPSAAPARDAACTATPLLPQRALPVAPAVGVVRRVLCGGCCGVRACVHSYPVGHVGTGYYEYSHGVL